MSEQHIPKRVEDYTNAFLWSSGLLLFMTLWVLAAIWGFFVVVALAWGVNKALSLPRSKDQAAP